MLGFLRIFSKTHRQMRRGGQAILRTVLDQARQPAFYEAAEVADTITGRFDLLTAHAFLVMRALRPYPELAELNQAFLDALFANIDGSFRELGVSDTRVPRKMRQAAEAFYGRLGAYEKGLGDNGLEGLMGALQRNLYRDETPGDGTLDAMARYMVGSLGRLALIDNADWQSGRLSFAPLELGSRS